MSTADDIKGKFHFVTYTMTHVPWAFIASLSSGLANYVIIVLIAKHYDLAAGGQFRLALAVIGLVSLFTLVDSGKVLIKHLVQNEQGVVRTLFLQRLRWSIGAMAVGIAVAGWYYSKGNDVWIALVIAAICLPISGPASLFVEVNQANKQFRLNAFYFVTAWGTVTAVITLLAFLKVDIVWLLSAYFVLLAIFHAYFFSRHKEVLEPENDNAPHYRRASLQLSGSGIFPIILESADKFLVTYFFGLEALGLYVIGVSSGRLFLHFVKPTLTIYYPILVQYNFSSSVLLAGFLGLSMCGIALALLMRYYFEYVLGPEYMAAYPLAAVILLGLGISFVGVVRYYSAVYHKEGSPRIPAITNIVTAVIVMTYMVLVLKFGGDYALLLCAASYPLRELVMIITISYLSNQKNNTIERSTVE